MSSSKKKLKTEIAKSNLDAVIQTLLVKTSGQLNNDIIQLSSRFEILKKQKLHGILSQSEITLEQNKLTNTLLSIVNNLPEDVIENSTLNNSEDSSSDEELTNISSPPTQPPQKSSLKKWLTIAATILASLAAIAEFSGYSLRDIFTTNNEQEALTLTVKVRAEDNSRPLKNEGNLVVDYGNGTQTIPIDKEGKIDLREIPVRLRGNPISIILEHQKYEGIKHAHSEEAKYILNGNPITLFVQMKSIFGIIVGRVKTRDGNQTIENVSIEVDGETSTTDEYGKIYIQMPKQKWKDTYTINATYNGVTKSEKYYPTIGNADIRF